MAANADGTAGERAAMTFARKCMGFDVLQVDAIFRDEYNNMTDMCEAKCKSHKIRYGGFTSDGKPFIGHGIDKHQVLSRFKLERWFHDCDCRIWIYFLDCEERSEYYQLLDNLCTESQIRNMKPSDMGDVVRLTKSGIVVFNVDFMHCNKLTRDEYDDRIKSWSKSSDSDFIETHVKSESKFTKDSLVIRDTKNGKIDLQMNYCGNTLVNHNIPVELLVGIYENALKDNKGDIHRIIDTLPYSQNIKAYLHNNVVPISEE